MSTVDAPPTRRKELLVRTLEQHREKLAELDEKLAEMPSRIEQARIAAIAQAPTKRSDALGSDVQKLREDQRKVERERENLAAEIAAVEVVLKEANEERRQERVAEVQAKAAEFDATEKSAWIKFAGDFVSLVAAYNGVLDAAEARMEYAAAVQWDNQKDRLEFETLLRTPWQRPFPIDLPRAVELALDASADPAGYGVHGGGLGIENRLGKLVEVMPDLRGVYRHGRLNAGAMHQTTSNNKAFEGSAPLGSFSAPLPARVGS